MRKQPPKELTAAIASTRPAKDIAAAYLVLSDWYAENLVNPRIMRVEAHDNNIMFFVRIPGDVTEHKISLGLDAECCSSSFFEEFSLKDAESLVGRDLLSISEVSWTEKECAPKYQDSVENHAIKVVTDDLTVVLDWRNESNGYYGGTCTMRVDGRIVDLERE